MTDAQALPRLLRGIQSGRTLTLSAHVRIHGPLPSRGRHPDAELVEQVELSGLRGRGGAHVPAALKLRAVQRRRRRPIVVANGAESEPASRKDAVLLSHAPHLVIDGAVVAASAVGADEAIVCVKRSDRRAWAAVAGALAERRGSGLREVAVRMAAAGARYVSGQETAVIAHLNGRPAVPTSVPPRPFERGVRNRPTLICNVETLAHMALVARHGARWFREIGSSACPGTALVTLGGAIARPGVYEVAMGSPLGALVERAGGVTHSAQALLVGGYGGRWLDAREMSALALTAGDEAPGACALGAGVLWVLGERACGVTETARVLEYLASESAGQCGPCLHGLRAIADAFQRLAHGAARDDETARLARWATEVTGRGACRHPDGAARFLATAMRVFTAEIERHRGGRCAGKRAASLPLPPVYEVAA